MFIFDGADGKVVNMNEHKLAKTEERLVIYARRLFATMGAQASDCLRSPFGIDALLKEKGLAQIKQEKNNPEQDTGLSKEESIFKSLMEDAFKKQEEEPEDSSEKPKVLASNEFSEAFRAISFDSGKVLTDEIMNMKFYNIVEFAKVLFAQAVALGYVLGRDEKEIISGKYDEKLERIDRLSAILELDREMANAELALSGKTTLPDEVLDQVEERRDVIKIMRKYIDNEVLSIKEIRNIADSTQVEHLVRLAMPFLTEISLADKVSERLCAAETEAKRLKKALEKTE